MKRTGIGLVMALLTLASWSHAAGKDSYVRKAEAELKEWNARVQQLQKKVEAAGIKTRDELDSQISVLRDKLSVAESKVSQVRDSSQSTWKGLRQAADQARKEVKDTYKSVSTALHRSGSTGD